MKDGYGALCSVLTSVSIDASCQDDILEFNKLLSSFPRRGRTGKGRSRLLAISVGGGSSNESFY